MARNHRITSNNKKKQVITNINSDDKYDKKQKKMTSKTNITTNNKNITCNNKYDKK